MLAALHARPHASPRLSAGVRTLPQRSSGYLAHEWAASMLPPPPPRLTPLASLPKPAVSLPAPSTAPPPTFAPTPASRLPTFAMPLPIPSTLRPNLAPAPAPVPVPATVLAPVPDAPKPIIRMRTPRNALLRAAPASPRHDRPPTLPLARIAAFLSRNKPDAAQALVIAKVEEHKDDLSRLRPAIEHALDNFIAAGAFTQARAIDALVPGPLTGARALVLLFYEPLPESASDTQRVRAQRRALRRAAPLLRGMRPVVLARALGRIRTMSEAGPATALALAVIHARLNGAASAESEDALGPQVARAAAELLAASTEPAGTSDFVQRARRALLRRGRVEDTLDLAMHAREVRVHETTDASGRIERHLSLVDNGNEPSDLQFELFAAGAQMSMLERRKNKVPTRKQRVEFREIGQRLANTRPSDVGGLTDAELDDLIARHQQYLAMAPTFSPHAPPAPGSPDALTTPEKINAELRLVADTLDVAPEPANLTLAALGPALVRKAHELRREVDAGATAVIQLANMALCIERYAALEQVLQGASKPAPEPFDAILARLLAQAAPPGRASAQRHLAPLAASLSGLHALTTFLSYLAHLGALRPAHIDAALASLAGRGVQPDAQFFAVLLAAAARAGDTKRAGALYGIMKTARVTPGAPAFASLFKAAALPAPPEPTGPRKLFMETPPLAPRTLFAELLHAHAGRASGAPPLATRGVMHVALRAFLARGDLLGARAVLRAFAPLRLRVDVGTYRIVLREVALMARRDIASPNLAAGPGRERWGARLLGPVAAFWGGTKAQRAGAAHDALCALAFPDGPGADPRARPTFKMARGAQAAPRGARWGAAPLVRLLQRACVLNVGVRTGWGERESGGVARKEWLLAENAMRVDELRAEARVREMRARRNSRPGRRAVRRAESRKRREVAAQRAQRKAQRAQREAEETRKLKEDWEWVENEPAASWDF